MNSESVWLAIAEIIISQEHSQHFLLNMTKLKYKAYVIQIHMSMCEETTDSYLQVK